MTPCNHPFRRFLHGLVTLPVRRVTWQCTVCTFQAEVSRPLDTAADRQWWDGVLAAMRSGTVLQVGPAPAPVPPLPALFATVMGGTGACPHTARVFWFVGQQGAVLWRCRRCPGYGAALNLHQFDLQISKALEGAQRR